MNEYRHPIDQVVRLLGENKGRMEMEAIFHKLGRLPESVDGVELAYRLARVHEYLLPYGMVHPEYGEVRKGDWILSDVGWGHYKSLKEMDDMDIPY